MSNLLLLCRVLISISLVTLVSDRGKRDPGLYQLFRRITPSFRNDNSNGSMKMGDLFVLLLVFMLVFLSVAGQECSKATKSWIMQRGNTMSSQRISLAKLKSGPIVQNSIFSVEVTSPKPSCNQLALQYSLSFANTDISGTCSNSGAQGACVCSLESISRPRSCRFTVDCSRELRKASTDAHLKSTNVRTITVSTEITGLRSGTVSYSYFHAHFSCSDYCPGRSDYTFSCSKYRINCNDYTLGDVRLECGPGTTYDITGCDCSPEPHTKRGAKRRKTEGVTLPLPAVWWFESTESYLEAVHAHLGTHGQLRERDLVVLWWKNPVTLTGEYLFGARDAYREALVEWVGQQQITCPEFEIPQCESVSRRQGKTKRGKAGKGKSRKARKKGRKKG